MFLQAGKACLAEETAALNSSFVVNGTWETTSCVAYDQIVNRLEILWPTAQTTTLYCTIRDWATKLLRQLMRLPDSKHR